MVTNSILARRIKRATNSLWLEVLWMEPYGYGPRWVVRTHPMNEPSVELAREQTLRRALRRAWRKVK